MSSSSRSLDKLQPSSVTGSNCGSKSQPDHFSNEIFYLSPYRTETQTQTDKPGADLRQGNNSDRITVWQIALKVKPQGLLCCCNASYRAFILKCHKLWFWRLCRWLHRSLKHDCLEDPNGGNGVCCPLTCVVSPCKVSISAFVARYDVTWKGQRHSQGTTPPTNPNPPSTRTNRFKLMPDVNHRGNKGSLRCVRPSG